MSKWPILIVIVGRMVTAQSLPLGQIIDDVQCKADGSQHYSLYLPSHFTPVRKWSIILAFDAGGRGRRAVERYQAAAEKYGFIIAGSNNSRNGPWEVSLNAAKAMTADVEQRFPVEAKRIYTAGMSGRARVAMGWRWIRRKNPREYSLLARRFRMILATRCASPSLAAQGWDDFNHQEMHELDRDLKSPHRIEVFDGGHAWLPVELATDGVEWMEIQAMKAGLRDRDAKEIDEIFKKRVARAEGQARSVDKMRELRSIAVDFEGLKDVGKFAERAAALERQGDVKDALKAERAEEERELQTTAEVYQLRDRMNNAAGFPKLKARVTQLLEQSKSAQDSTDRRIARRVLTGLSASSRSIHNPEFQELLNQIRPPGATGQP